MQVGAISRLPLSQPPMPTLAPNSFPNAIADLPGTTLGGEFVWAGFSVTKEFL